jgi:hypothetical protein
MRIKELFGGNRNTIYGVELRDIDLSKEIFGLMLKVEGNLNGLKEALRKENPLFKNAKIAELENNFLMLKSKVEALRTDVKMIMDIEVQNKDYIMINDEGYLEDKYERLTLMSSVLDELIDLMIAKPSAIELRRDLIEYVYGKVNILVDAVNNIINDDKHLESTYSKLSYL